MGTLWSRPDLLMGNDLPRVKLSADLPRLRAAIEEARGNISRAAQALGITKPWAMELVRRNDLNEWARDLRVKNGQGSTGYPRGMPRPSRRSEEDVTVAEPVAV